MTRRRPPPARDIFRLTDPSERRLRFQSFEEVAQVGDGEAGPVEEPFCQPVVARNQQISFALSTAWLPPLMREIHGVALVVSTTQPTFQPPRR